MSYNMNAYKNGLSELYQPIKEDLSRVEDRIAHVVKSTSRLFPPDLYYFHKPGKRLRPALTLLVYRIHHPNGTASEGIIDQSAAIEMMHLASLIHDDIVDAAPTRRGYRTLHRLFNEKTAVLVGDYLYTHALKMLIRRSSKVILDILADTTTEMAYIELSQVLFDVEKRLAKDYYFEMISKKTANLFGACAFVGADSTNSNPKQKETFRSFGWNFGMAFQIIDDIMDYISPEEQIGKPVFQDLLNGIPTLPAILLYESGCSDIILRIIQTKEMTPELSGALSSQLAEKDIIARCIQEAERYMMEAKELLSQVVDEDTNRCSSIYGICDYVLQQPKLTSPAR